MFKKQPLEDPWVGHVVAFTVAITVPAAAVNAEQACIRIMAALWATLLALWASVSFCPSRITPQMGSYETCGMVSTCRGSA